MPCLEVKDERAVLHGVRGVTARLGANLQPAYTQLLRYIARDTRASPCTHRQPVLGGVLNRRHHIAHVVGLDDHRRVAVQHQLVPAVTARSVIARGAGKVQGAAQLQNSELRARKIMAESPIYMY